MINLQNDKEVAKRHTTSILAKWRQKPRRKGSANLQVLLPQEVYRSRHFANMPTVGRLAQKIENTAELISQNPNIFPKSESNNIYKAVILKFNTMYYRVMGGDVEILSFFSNRQSPRKRKITT